MALPPRIDAKAVRERIGPYADKVASIDERNAIYAELIGFVPPRIEARMAVTGALDPTLLEMQECASTRCIRSASTPRPRN